MSENKQKGHVDPLEDTRAESIRPGKMIAGAPIGGYHLENVLGEGGMGVVWSARDPLLDRTIAIKVLKSRDAHVSMRTRLLREAQAMARLKHPNVLTVHEVGTEGDRDFIVMELVDGGPLDHWLAFGPSFDEVMTALMAAGRGLAAAHAAGLVHRDFKPNNVLRSKDGRVLVTDFGLARGLGEDWQNTSVTASGSGFPVTDPSLDPSVTPSVPTTSSQRRDNVLDSPLTRTGAMIGTPAYMAPEQFAGSEPDPRTDQFAFCITAWQALTGARPFHGRTIDELRQAAGGGVATVVAELPKPIRAVLTRGLEPDPAKRWPDLQTLLRELELAAKPRKKRWPLIAGAAGVVAIAVIAVLATRGAAEPKCEPVDAAWGDAWSDKQKLAEGVQWIAPVLEDHRRRWTGTYEQTCKGSARAEGRLGCLRAVRDRVAAVAELLRDPKTHPAFDPYLLLTPPEVCGGRPSAIPTFPDDDRRSRSVAVLAKAIAEPAAPSLEADAKAVGWAPIVPIVQVAIGLDQLRHGDVARARDGLERVVVATEAVDPRLAAFARLGLLAASLKELAQPEDRPGTKPETLHEDLTRLLAYARSAVKAANDEPVLAGVLAFLEAEALADLAERAPRKMTYAEALGRANDARRLFEGAGDLRRIARTSVLIAEIHLRRGAAGALADAEFVARSASEMLDRAKLAPIPALDEVLGRIAFLRSETRTAHRWLDRSAPLRAPVTGDLVEGVVVGPDGKPVMNAVVVVWTGDLHGDPVRAFTDRRTVHGEIVETATEGKFTVHRRDGAAIVAESGVLRSQPQQLLGDKLVLKLAPTTELAGKIETREQIGIAAYVRYPVGAHGWFVHASVDKDQAFRITGLPRATIQVGLSGRAGTGARRTAIAVVNLATETALPRRLVWSAGGTLDVIVRGKLGDGANAWIVNELELGKVRSRAALEAFASSASEVSYGPLLPIGSRITDAGRQLYAAGDRHALFVGDFEKRWACAAPSREPTAPVTCQQIGDKAALVLDLP